MARIPLPTPEALTGAPREVYDRIAAHRGVPVENAFLAMVNTPELADGVLGLASALRACTALLRPLHELAVVTVGPETGAEYEVNHRWNAALKAGVRRETMSSSRVGRGRPCTITDTSSAASTRSFGLATSRAVSGMGTVWNSVPDGMVSAIPITFTCWTRMASQGLAATPGL
jgi:hypothetical protein